MNEELLKMNGLSLEILDALSFESHLGIPLKKNLHYFDKDLLIVELVAMTEWLDEQEILSDIALDYRVKSLDSIRLKYDRYYPDHQTRKVFNDILGFPIEIQFNTLFDRQLKNCASHSRYFSELGALFFENR